MSEKDKTKKDKKEEKDFNIDSITSNFQSIGLTDGDSDRGSSANDVEMSDDENSIAGELNFGEYSEKDPSVLSDLESSRASSNSSAVKNDFFRRKFVVAKRPQTTGPAEGASEIDKITEVLEAARPNTVAAFGDNLLQEQEGGAKKKKQVSFANLADSNRKREDREDDREGDQRDKERGFKITRGGDGKGR